MSAVDKYAILDTDFVFKANIIKKDDRVLADEVLAFPSYRFFCHQKMKDGLEDDGTRAAQGWLDQRIATVPMCMISETCRKSSISGLLGWGKYHSFFPTFGINMQKASSSPIRRVRFFYICLNLIGQAEP